MSAVVTPAFQPVKGHEERDLHDIIAARVASWWWGGSDEDIGGYLSTAKLIARDPMHEAIYLARIADDSSKFRQLKDWAYKQAADFAMTKGAGIRKRTVIESYSPKWGHQAARDGMARALWPWLEHEMPGRDARCQQTNAGHQAYLRVRDEIQSRTLDGFIAFMFDLKCLVEGRWTRDMIDRWEAATGADFSRAAI